MKKVKIDWQQLSKEELQEIAKRRKKNGCFTDDALVAQRILWNEAGQPFVGRFKIDGTVRGGGGVDYYDETYQG